VTCGSGYTVLESAVPADPQKVSHLSADGYNLNSYTVQTYDTACPIDSWLVSSVNDGGTLVTGYPQLTLTGTQPAIIVKPADYTVHGIYTFFLQAKQVSGGSYGWFGAYIL